MREAHLVLAGAVVLSLVAASSPSAQQGDAAKRRPKQTHDKGIDDAVVAGQEGRIGERQVEGLVILTRPDGTVVAELDESFHDAVVATKHADGTISYTCLHGLPAANAHVSEHPAVSTTPATPPLEEK
jgi:hypothetical protein